MMLSSADSLFFLCKPKPYCSPAFAAGAGVSAAAGAGVAAGASFAAGAGVETGAGAAELGAGAVVWMFETFTGVFTAKEAQMLITQMKMASDHVAFSMKSVVLR